MRVIGITGLPGAGKSTIAQLLGARGAEVIDADAIGHRLLEPGTATVGRLQAEFGEDIVGADGEVERAELARRAFADAAATQRLNAIVHPALLQQLHERIASCREAGSGLAVVDAALLVEWGLEAELDGVIYVDADKDIRLTRLARSRGWDEATLSQRQQAQWSAPRKRASAHWVIDNNDEMGDELHGQLERLWPRLMQAGESPHERQA